MVTKDAATHGAKGWVPTAYLTEMRENKLNSVSLDKSNLKVGAASMALSDAKKYKPVAKNLKKRNSGLARLFTK